MDETFQTMLARLCAGGVEVEIDVHPYNTAVGGSSHLLPALDDARNASLARGERCAYLYDPVWIAQHAGWRLHSMSMLVTAAQVRELLAAGATWVGPAHHRPH